MTSTETNGSSTTTTVPLKIGSRDKSVGWYTPTLENITEVQRDLLENYSHVAPDRVIPHILEVVGRLRLFLIIRSMTDNAPIARPSLGNSSLSMYWTAPLH